MTDPLLNDKAIQSASYALDGLAKRQGVIADNLANIDTPGYRAKNVEFESALRAAVAGGDNELKLAQTASGHLASPAAAAPAMQVKSRVGGALRADGNSVDIDVELTQMSETGIRYMALSQTISKKFLLMKTIIQGR